MTRINYVGLIGLLALGIGCGESTPAGPVNMSPDGGANPDGNSAVDAPPTAPVDQPTTAQRSAQYASDVIRQLGGAINFTTAEGSLLSRLAPKVTGVRRSGAAQAIPSPLPDPLARRLAETPAFKSLRPRPSFLTLASPEENLDDTAGDVEAFFKMRLFTAANLESSNSTTATYLLRGDPTCRPLPSEIADGRLDRVDGKCAIDLMKLQVRIVVTGDGDGYRFQILLGPDKYELSVIIVHSNLLGWEVDLAKARMATMFANTVLMNDGERASEPFPFAVLKGRLKVAVEKLAEKKVNLSWSVLEPLEVQDMDHHSFAMKMADPAISLTADGAAKTLTLQLNIPQTDLRAPWDPKDMGAQNSDLHVALGGLTGTTALSEMAEEVSFTGLGIGNSFVEVRSSKIFELTFNPASENKMNMKVTPITGDQARFEITPKLDLSLRFGLETVASEFNEPPESFLQSQTYALVLMGGSRVVVETVADSETFEGGFKMVEGSLHLATTADAEATVDVPMGQCLTGVPEPADDAHPILGNLTAATCP
jgi:hypothetical protein